MAYPLQFFSPISDVQRSHNTTRTLVDLIRDIAEERLCRRSSTLTRRQVKPYMQQFLQSSHRRCLQSSHRRCLQSSHQRCLGEVQFQKRELSHLYSYFVSELTPRLKYELFILIWPRFLEFDSEKQQSLVEYFMLILSHSQGGQPQITVEFMALALQYMIDWTDPTQCTAVFNYYDELNREFRRAVVDHLRITLGPECLFVLNRAQVSCNSIRHCLGGLLLAYPKDRLLPILLQICRYWSANTLEKLSLAALEDSQYNVVELMLTACNVPVTCLSQIITRVISDQKHPLRDFVTIYWNRLNSCQVKELFQCIVLADNRSGIDGVLSIMQSKPEVLFSGLYVAIQNVCCESQVALLDYCKRLSVKTRSSFISYFLHVHDRKVFSDTRTTINVIKAIMETGPILEDSINQWHFILNQRFEAFADPCCDLLEAVHNILCALIPHRNKPDWLILESIFDVSFEEIRQYPLDILRQLCARKKLPDRILLVSTGHDLNHRAIDHGGVSRQVYSMLGTALYTHLSVDNGTPCILDPSLQNQAEKVYTLLGQLYSKLLIHNLNKTEHIIVGWLFESHVFHLIQEILKYRQNQVNPAQGVNIEEERKIVAQHALNHKLYFHCTVCFECVISPIPQHEQAVTRFRILIQEDSDVSAIDYAISMVDAIYIPIKGLISGFSHELCTFYAINKVEDIITAFQGMEISSERVEKAICAGLPEDALEKLVLPLIEVGNPDLIFFEDPQDNALFLAGWTTYTNPNLGAPLTEDRQLEWAALCTELLGRITKRWSEQIEWLRIKVRQADQEWLTKLVISMTGRSRLLPTTQLLFQPTLGTSLASSSCLNLISIPYRIDTQDLFNGSLDGIVQSNDFNSA